jgi:hypothetical protein
MQTEAKLEELTSLSLQNRPSGRCLESLRSPYRNHEETLLR